MLCLLAIEQTAQLHLNHSAQISRGVVVKIHHTVKAVLKLKNCSTPYIFSLHNYPLLTRAILNNSPDQNQANPTNLAD
jgi:hypothetical protein